MSEFEDVLKKTLERLAKSAEDERRKSNPYKDLFSKSDTCESLLREVEFKMTGIVLDACQVLKDKFGFKEIPQPVFDILQMLPFVETYLEKQIVKEEGISCCVDKVYHLLSNDILSRRKQANRGEKVE